jgi:hypothetical protein
MYDVKSVCAEVAWLLSVFWVHDGTVGRNEVLW